MQDNNSKDFDEQFIDQAWLEMSQLLDKEMPVQPRRRIAGWLWLLAGLFLFLLLSGGAYHLYRSGEKQPPSTPLSSPTAQMDSPSTSPGTEEIQATIKDQGSMTQAAVIQKKQPDSESVAFSGTAVAPPFDGKTTKLPPLSIVKRPASADEVGKEHPAALGELNPEDIKAKKKAVVIPEEKIAAPTRSRWSGRPASPVEKVVLRPVSTIVESHAEWQQPTARQPRILRVAAEGGAYLWGHSFSRGLSGGLAIELRPRTSRLYLRTGAFFRWYQQELKTEKTAIRLENSFFKDPQPDGSFVNRSTQLTTEATVNQTSYIDFPILAGFQWSSRLAFESGIQAGFLANSQSMSRWRLINESSLPDNPEGNNTIYESKRGPAYNILNNTSLDVIATIAYRPSQHITLRLSYQHGLADILANQREQAYTRGVQLSLAWYLIQ